MNIKENGQLKISKIDVCVIGFIILWGIFLLPQLSLPYVTDDEFGYWMSGAFFGGYDWKSVSSNIAYYAYGYGLFLAPFIMLIESPVLCFRVAVFGNVIWLMGIYFVVKYIVKKCLNRGEHTATTIAVCTLLYSNILVQSKVTWPELFSYFLMLAIVALLYAVTEKKASVIQYVILALSVVCLYCMHQRYLGVLIAIVLSFFLQFFIDLHQRKRICVFFGVLFIGLMGHALLKDIYQRSIWSTIQLSTNKNDYSSIFSDLRSIFNLESILGIALSALGQVYYCAIAALGVSIFGIGAIWSGLCEALKKRKRQQIVRYVCFVLMGLGTLGISSIFWRSAYFQYDRADCLLYGRYIEGIIIILLVFGMDKLIEDIRNKRRGVLVYYSVIILLITIWGAAIAFFCNEHGVGSYNMISSVSGGLYWKEGVYLWYVPVVILLLWLGIIKLCYKEKITTKAIKNIGLICYCVITILTANKMLEVIVSTNGLNNACIELAEELAKENYEKYNIYYLTEKNVWKDRKKNNLQFLLKDEVIKCLSRKQSEKAIEDEYGLVVTSSDSDAVYQLLLEGFRKVYEKEDVVALVAPESVSQEKIVLTTSSNMYGSDYNLSEEEEWTSDGTGGYLCFGPYLSVPYGRYTISFELEYIEGAQRDIGYVVLSDNQKVIQTQGIDKQKFIDGKCTIELEVILPKGSESLEYSVYIKEGNVVSTSPATITRERNITLEKNSILLYTMLLDGYEIKEYDAEDVVLVKTEVDNEEVVITTTGMYNSDFDTKGTDYWTNDGKEGFLCYGPYLEVPAGEYAIEFEISHISGTYDDIGYVVLMDNEDILQMQGISLSNCKNQKYTVELHAMLPEGSEALHYSIYIKEDNVVSVSPGTISRKKDFVLGKEDPYCYTLMLSGYQIKESEEETVILQKGEREDIETVIPPISLYGSDCGIANEDYWESTGKEGFLCYGPYVEVPAGKYTIEVEMEYISGTNSDVGRIVVQDEERVLGIEPITLEDFENKRQKKELQVILPNGSESLHYSIYIKQDCMVKTFPCTIVAERLENKN